MDSRIKKLENIIIAALIVLLIIFFTVFIPVWQFLSYHVHCDRWEDKCTIKETLSGYTVKTFKISDTKTLVTKDIKITSGEEPITIPYITLVKKDGSTSFVRGLIADGRDFENFLKFNNFINSNTQNTLDYINNNVDFNMHAITVLLLGLVIMFAIPVSYPLIKIQLYGVSGEDKSFNIKYLIILSIYVFFIAVSIFTSIRANKIYDENQEKAGDIRWCYDIAGTFLRGDGEKIMYLFYSDKIGSHTIYKCDMKNMTNEKLKNVYKASIHYYTDENKTQQIMDETENTLTVKAKIAPYRACMQKLAFYAQNSCLEEGECYVDVKIFPDEYPEEEFETKRYNLTLVPEKTKENEITLRKKETMKK
ncbi:MAG: hypothetical protein K6A44_03035 [bacterium]|nr:hypothetical protein [bacterium]